MMRRSDSPPIALRLREAARLLGVSERTLWHWANEGRVPCRAMRTGGRTIWLFSREALEKWAAGHGDEENGQ